jgi:hypothetical protein
LHPLQHAGLSRRSEDGRRSGQNPIFWVTSALVIRPESPIDYLSIGHNGAGRVASQYVRILIQTGSLCNWRNSLDRSSGQPARLSVKQRSETRVHTIALVCRSILTFPLRRVILFPASIPPKRVSPIRPALPIISL